jgi:hypothetical protein
MKEGIDRFAGDWRSDDGWNLSIVKASTQRARVTLLGPDDEPVRRPYWDNRPTVDMPADYDDYMGAFTVHLWEPDRGFTMHLDHHLSDRWVDLDQEILSPSLSQYEKDRFLDQYHGLFGRLADFKRMKRQNQHDEA